VQVTVERGAEISGDLSRWWQRYSLRWPQWTSLCALLVWQQH